MSWFYLALLAPLFYAITVLFDDNLLRFVYKGPYLATTFAGVFGALPLLSRLFLPSGAISLDLALLAILAGFLNITYYFFYFRGLALDMPSIVIALFSLAPATIPVLAYFFVHERLTVAELAGFTIVLLASAGLAATDIRKFKFSKALIPLLIAVVLMDIVAVLSKYVYQRVSFYPAYLCYAGGMGLGGLAFFLVQYTSNRATLRTINRSLKKLLPVFVAAELLNLGAEFTLNLAIDRGPVSLVKAIEGVQPMFMLLMTIALYPVAPRFFREAEAGGLARKLVLMALSVLGLILISRAASV